MGGTDHLQSFLPRPALRQQLLPWVELEAVIPFLGGLPAVATGPNPMQLQGCAIGLAQQQSASLLGAGRLQGALQNDQAMTIDAQLVWRLGSHPDTLCRGF
jgi:hypothetical protein